MQSKGQVRQTSYENNDLISTYRSVYEHHKKDADGNTIPHEGEEINEALPLIPLLGKVAAIAGKAALGAGKAAAGKAAAGKAVAGKALVKTGVKLGGKTGGKIAKSIVRDPLDAYNKARMVGDMVPKPSVPSIEKKSTGNVSAGSYQAASADLFDIVKGQLLDEGYSENEITEIMVNLTEEQLEEFMKTLATRAAQYGANIGKEGSLTGFLNPNAKKQDQQLNHVKALLDQNLNQAMLVLNHQVHLR